MHSNVAQTHNTKLLHRGYKITRRGQQTAVLALMASMSCWANAQISQFNDIRKPQFIYQRMAGDDTMPTFYLTPQAAFADFASWMAKACAQTPPGVYNNACQTFSPLRACTSADASSAHLAPYYYFVWGVVDYWCNDYSHTLQDGTLQSGTESVVATAPVCPDGYKPLVLSQLSGTGQPGDPGYYDGYCYKPQPQISRHGCGKGDPIYPSAKSNRQFEQDYLSPDGTLSFQRIYDSAIGRFSSEYDVDYYPPVAKSIIASDVLAATVTMPDFVNGPVTDVFHLPFLGLNYAGSQASFTGTDRAHEDFAVSGGSGAPGQNYFKDRLTSVVSSGQTYWVLSRRDENEILLFDSTGRLAKRQHATGASVSTIYSPTNGFLASLTDDHGRSLTVLSGADPFGNARLSGLIDPAGRLISYSYNSTGNLNQVTYQDGSQKTYAWNEPGQMSGDSAGVDLMTGVTDESGARVATFKFLNGSAVSTQQAGNTSG